MKFKEVVVIENEFGYWYRTVEEAKHYTLRHKLKVGLDKIEYGIQSVEELEEYINAHRTEIKQLMKEKD